MKVAEKLKRIPPKSEEACSGQGALPRSRSYSCELSFFAKQQEEYKEQLRQSESAKQFRRSRAQTISCSSYFTEKPATRRYMKDRVLTENAKYLSSEQMHALEMDIFKPLDFYEMFFDRMKARDDGDEEKEQDDKSTVMNWQDFKNLMNCTIVNVEP